MPTIIAGLFLDVTHTNNGDVLESQMRFIVNTNEPKTYMMTVDAHFQFNHGTNEFDLVFSQSVLTAIFTSIFTMVRMFKAGDLVYMEDAGAFNCEVYRISDGVFTARPALVSTNVVSQLLVHNGHYHAMVSTGLVKLAYNHSSNALTFDSYVSPIFPASTYKVAFTAYSATLV